MSTNDSLRESQRLLSLIEETLVKSNSSDGSLYTGSAGLSLFYACRYKQTGEEQMLDRMSDNLDLAIAAINSEGSQNSFCSGITGISWAMNFLINQDLLDVDRSIFFSELDESILSFSLAKLDAGVYDFMHGGLGAAVYLLSRLPCPESEAKLILILGKLAQIVEKDESQVWSSTEKAINWEERKEYNMGLAHGLPSVVSILCHCMKAGIMKEACEKMIRTTLNFIEENRCTEGLSLYPSIISPDGPVTGSRLAWCYGDLGVGSAYWQAGKTLNNKEYEEKALNIFNHAAKRTALDENKVADATFCHGTAGIAHVFNRMYKETGLPQYDDARFHWLRETILMSKHRTGPAGFKVRSENEWIDELGILEGVAGIGLVLSGFLTDQPDALDWDRVFLLS